VKILAKKISIKKKKVRIPLPKVKESKKVYKRKGKNKSIDE
jgi:hypothetical protein